MRIILLTQYFPPDPDSSRGLPFAKWLQAHGHEVTVLTAFPHYSGTQRNRGQRWRSWDEVDGVRVLRVALYRSHDRSAWRRVLNYFSFALSAAVVGLPSVGRADVIYVTSTPPTVGFPAWVAKRAWGTPYVFNVVDIWPEAVLSSGMLRPGKLSGLARRGIERMCRWLYGQAAAVTTISAGYRDILVQQGFTPPQRLHVVYNAAPEAALRVASPDRLLAARFGLEDKVVFLYAGNFGVYQGVRTIVAAAAQLRDVPQVQIALAGDGILEAELRRSVAEQGLRNVTFLGCLRPEEMPSVYALADALLIHLNDLLFLRATVPGKTQISLAAGRAIVIAATGEAADIIQHAEAGIACRPEDPAALADAIRRLALLSRPEREEMGARGQRYYRRWMATEVTAPTIEELLRDVCLRDTPRGGSAAAGRPHGIRAQPGQALTRDGGGIAPGGGIDNSQPHRRRSQWQFLRMAGAASPIGTTSRQRGWRCQLKRALDVVGAGAALVLAAPLMAAILVAVRWRLGKPVLYVQARTGRAGRPIRVHKFRTMTHDCAANGQPLPDSARLPPLGLWLRAWSLDELPQLWDVLTGQLSLVGPRPLLPQYTARYTPAQARRLDVLPGLTGWAQVRGRNSVSWQQRFDLDRWYVEHWSIALDLRILALTAVRVLTRTGISAPGEATMPEFLGDSLPLPKPITGPGPVVRAPEARQ